MWRPYGPSERKKAKIELLPTAFKPFLQWSQIVWIDVFCRFLKRKRSEIRIKFCLSCLLLIKPTTVNFLRVFAVCGRTRNFLRLLVDRILNFLRLEVLVDKAQFNARTSCTTSCACIIFGLYCTMNSTPLWEKLLLKKQRPWLQSLALSPLTTTARAMMIWVNVAVIRSSILDLLQSKRPWR